MNLRAAHFAGLILVAGLSALPATGQDFPRHLENAYGSAELSAAPKRIVALSDIDFDIALALGLEPVASPNAGYNGAQTAPYHDRFLADWQGDKPLFFSAYEGIPFETLVSVEPDVILATGAWSLNSDYTRLASIAPVVALDTTEFGVTSWQEQTRTVGRALALEEKAEAVIADIEAEFAAAAAANPQFAGKSFVYGVVHPEQLTYQSTLGDTSTVFFKLLGFTQPSSASEMSAEASGVSRERLNLFEADILLFAFPFEGEAATSQAALESDPLFSRLEVVSDGRYVTVPPLVASTLAYPSPLSTAWALGEMLPSLTAASQK